MVESSDKTWSTGEENGKPLQYSCLLLISSALLGPYHFCPLSSPFLHETFPWYLWFSSRDLKSFPFCCFPLFVCIVHWGEFSYLSLLFFGTLHSNGYIFPFLLGLFPSPNLLISSHSTQTQLTVPPLPGSLNCLLLWDAELLRWLRTCAPMQETWVQSLG